MPSSWLFTLKLLRLIEWNCSPAPSNRCRRAAAKSSRCAQIYGNEDNLGAGLALAPENDPASGLRTRYARLNGTYNDNELTYGAYKYTANVYANHTLTDGALRGLGLGGGVQMRGRRLVGNAPTSPFDYLYADSYYLVTGALSYRLKVWNQPLRLQLNVSNLLDDELVQPTRYGSYTVNGVTRFVPDRYYIQPPRRYTLTATYSF